MPDFELLNQWRNAGVEVGRKVGVVAERYRILDLLEKEMCFDALADPDGRCNNHSGKCYEIRLFIEKNRHWEKGN